MQTRPLERKSEKAPTRPEAGWGWGEALLGRGPVRTRLILAAVSLLLYALLFWPVHHLIDRSAVILALVPIMTCALTFGRWSGLAAGLLMPLVYFLVLKVVEGDGAPPFIGRHFWISHSLFAGLGLAAGYLHELKEKIRGQYRELQEGEARREELVLGLQQALEEVNLLSGLLPICSRCKKIRNPEGQWEVMEHYIGTRSEAEFTHSICQECAGVLYPDLNTSKLNSK